MKASQEGSKEFVSKIRLKFERTIISGKLNSKKISNACKESILKTFDAMERMEDWAFERK